MYLVQFKQDWFIMAIILSSYTTYYSLTQTYFNRTNCLYKSLVVSEFVLPWIGSYRVTCRRTQDIRSGHGAESLEIDQVDEWEIILNQSVQFSFQSLPVTSAGKRRRKKWEKLLSDNDMYYRLSTFSMLFYHFRNMPNHGRILRRRCWV